MDEIREMELEEGTIEVNKFGFITFNGCEMKNRFPTEDIVNSMVGLHGIEVLEDMAFAIADGLQMELEYNKNKTLYGEKSAWESVVQSFEKESEF
jgi:hypothetical protein